MRHFTRALITGSALLTLALAGCQANDKIKIGTDASKDEIAAIINEAMIHAKSTSGV